MGEPPTIDSILLELKRRAIMHKAIDASAPDPEETYQRLKGLAERYPPVLMHRGDDVGYDFGPLVRGAAREYGLDYDQLAADFMCAARFEQGGI